MKDVVCPKCGYVHTVDMIVHGYSRFKNQKCRCEACVVGHRIYMRQYMKTYRDRLKARKNEPAND